MSTFTRDNTEVAFELEGAGTQHRAEEGGVVIALERWNAGLDTAEMFAELPDGACPVPHWGYVIKGRITIRYNTGRSETLSAGQAYYMAPGHNAHVDEDVELVEFTRADDEDAIGTLAEES